MRRGLLGEGEVCSGRRKAERKEGRDGAGRRSFCSFILFVLLTDFEGMEQPGRLDEPR